VGSSERQHSESADCRDRVLTEAVRGQRSDEEISLVPSQLPAGGTCAHCGHRSVELIPRPSVLLVDNGYDCSTTDACARAACAGGDCGDAAMPCVVQLLHSAT
jgi:hypothetical protein